MFGLLIKNERIAQNMSQEALCKGICAVSYLSKIENGVAKPNHEIIVKLMDVLGVILPKGSDDLEDYDAKIHKAIDAIKTGQYKVAKEIYYLLIVVSDMLSKSPLMITWTLFKCYIDLIDEKSASVDAKLKGIESYLIHFDAWQNYHFYCLKAKLCNELNDYDGAVNYYKRAQLSNNDGYLLAGLASSHFFNGDYLTTIKDGNEAFKLLMEEGNLSIGIEVSFTIAGAYSNDGQLDQAIAIYKRLLNLSEYQAHNYIKYGVFYNIGATYLMSGDNEIAMNYLQKALLIVEESRKNDLKIGMIQKLYLYQKLILCHLNLSDVLSARTWIIKSNELLSNKDFNLGENTTSLEYSFDWLSFYLKCDNPVDKPEFLMAIEKTYFTSLKDSHFGFHMMYGHYLMYTYKMHRKYKEALKISDYLRVSWKVDLKEL